MLYLLHTSTKVDVTLHDLSLAKCGKLLFRISILWISI